MSNGSIVVVLVHPELCIPQWSSRQSKNNEARDVQA